MGKDQHVPSDKPMSASRLTRRACLVTGGAVGTGAVLGLSSNAIKAAMPWRPVRSDESIVINGISYEAQCGADTQAIQRSKNGVIRFAMVPENFWKKDSRWDSERAELAGWRNLVSHDRPIWSSWQQ